MTPVLKLRRSRRADSVGLVIQSLYQSANRKLSRDATAFAAAYTVGQGRNHAVAHPLAFSRAVNADKILIVRPLARFGRMASRRLQSAIRFQIKNSPVCGRIRAHVRGAVRGGVRQAQNCLYSGSTIA